MATIERFVHQPLDQDQPSIRLIKILPDLSEKGLVQCSMNHSSTADTYMCLSYVWDYRPRQPTKLEKAPNNRPILINNGVFYVRENLVDFLRMARSKGTQLTGHQLMFDLETPIWIDAICIDQSNVSERVHQVAQMGEIYSRASNVHVWFGRFIGDSSPTWRNVVTGLSKTPNSYSSPMRAVDLLEDSMKDLAVQLRRRGPGVNTKFSGRSFWQTSLVGHVFSNVYWERAWTVQEVVLARKLIFWVNSIPMTPSTMLYVDSVAAVDRKSTPEAHLLSTCSGFQGFALKKFRLESFRGQKDLVTLLAQFHNKQCTNPQDRVYSLLGLCREQSRVPVDYTIGPNTLACRVLQSHPGSMCVCAAAIVAKALDLQEVGNPAQYKANPTDEPWIRFEVPSYSARLVRLDDGSLRDSLELNRVCRCFEEWNNPDRKYENDHLLMSVARQKNGQLVVRVPLSTLPKLIARPFVGCWESYSESYTVPGQPKACVEYGSPISDTLASATHLVTVLRIRRGRFVVRESLEDL